MNKIKKTFFYVGNLFIGVLIHYVYIYLWVLFSWGEKMQLYLLETALTLLLGSIIFLGFNYFLLKKENNSKKYWWIGFSLVVFGTTTVSLILGLS